MFDQLLLFQSLFSPATAAKGQNPVLILQFILRDLIQSETKRLAQHAALLPAAFPKLAKEAEAFLRNIYAPSEELIRMLEPFVLSCKTNENLLYFLVKHQKSPFIQAMLDKICPEGMEKLKITIAAQYQKRGFYLSQWTL